MIWVRQSMTDPNQRWCNHLHGTSSGPSLTDGSSSPSGGGDPGANPAQGGCPTFQPTSMQLRSWSGVANVLTRVGISGSLRSCISTEEVFFINCNFFCVFCMFSSVCFIVLFVSCVILYCVKCLVV